ncbi:S-adenosyl-L-methionine-dependent methyltransferase [Xylariales sp. PMI_506]|nr:S-adenosyl-L-methionine-dependent methyltransferase [Xylariales sp. PMI_506]
MSSNLMEGSHTTDNHPVVFARAEGSEVGSAVPDPQGRAGEGQHRSNHAASPPRTGTIADPVSVQEHGRTWQNYKPGKYFMPNDAAEQERLDASHAAFRCLLGGPLHRAPLQGDPPRVLDIGTGTGVWAIDFAREHPRSNVIGMDLSLIQPDMADKLPNVTFVRADAEEGDDDVVDDGNDDKEKTAAASASAWAAHVGEAPFDFIHMRLMFTCFRNHRAVAARAYARLQPGGWLEYQDLTFSIDADDSSHHGTALHRWTDLARAAAARRGIDAEAPARYREYLIGAGFVDVAEERVRLYGNPWPAGGGGDDERARAVGGYIEKIGAQVVRTLSPRLLDAESGLSRDEIEEVVTQAQEDIHNRDIHFYWPGYIVYGRKPFDHELKGVASEPAAKAE